jgi:uncharacterized protein (DUF1330 family)
MLCAIPNTWQLHDLPLTKYGARFLVRGGRFDAMEGSAVSAMSSLSLGMAT